MKLDGLNSINILNNFKIDLNKGKKPMLIGTISQKTGKKKVADGKWVEVNDSFEQNKEQIRYNELFDKFKNNTLTTEEIAELRKYDNKDKIDSAFLINDLYLSQSQKEKKYKFLNAGFKNFDYRKIKTELDNLFNVPSKVSIKINELNNIEFEYTSKKLLLRRDFKLDELNNTLTVDHFHFKILDGEKQGKGYAKHILKTFYNYYKKCNVNSIELLANSDVGGYAWAKYGFMTTKQNVDLLLSTELGNKPHLKKYMLEFIEVYNSFYSTRKDTELFPVNLLACLTDKDGRQFGKELLLGSDWNGTLDLNNAKQKTIFENYLNNEIKQNNEIESFINKLPEKIETSKIYKQDNQLAENTIKSFKNKVQTTSSGNLDEFMLWHGNTELVDVFNISPIESIINKKNLLSSLEETNVNQKNVYLLKHLDKYYSLNDTKVVTELLSNKEKIKCLVYELK